MDIKLDTEQDIQQVLQYLKKQHDIRLLELEHKHHAESQLLELEYQLKVEQLQARLNLIQDNGEGK